jgi:transcriptional regulator with XRE-family HTH domain
MTFGHYLREVRRGRHLPISQLAERTGISAAAISELECNRRGPSYAEVQLLARALSLPEEEVLRRAGIIGARRTHVV